MLYTRPYSFKNSAGADGLRSGFERNMADSPMVIRKLPYETMPTPDPNPPLAAKLSLFDTSVAGKHPQIAFIRRAPKDGTQNIIWAFSHTSPGSVGADAHISIQGSAASVPRPLSPLSTPAESSAPETAVGPEESSEKAEREREGETNGGSERRGGLASLMHGAFCMAGFLLAIPPGVLMVQYAKVTGPGRSSYTVCCSFASVPGRFIAGGTLAYLFMDGNASGGTAANEVIPMMIYPKAEPHPHAQSVAGGVPEHHVFAFPNATPSSNFKSALNAALAQYKEKTGKDLLAHELADELRTCESVDVVLTLRDQIQGL
ncbi:hypothetical protein EDB85DRAFT_2149882 [Lactarius pseudohatsudake]|nr:hypothetical protein EDB85DRAFT_2149882 [Lactarius pseudohatsudake]